MIYRSQNEKRDLNEGGVEGMRGRSYFGSGKLFWVVVELFNEAQKSF